MKLQTLNNPLQNALQSVTTDGTRDMDAILEALITSEVQLLGVTETTDEDPQLLQLQIEDSVNALALFSSENMATQMSAGLGLTCELISVPGYWPFLELNEATPLIIDAGHPHNLVLPADVMISLRPVIRTLLETHS